MKFDYEKIMKENTVIYCNEEWKAKSLLKWADSKGLRWKNGKSYIRETYYDSYVNDTCYDLFNGLYGSLDYSKRNDEAILSYEEVLIEDEEESSEKNNYSLHSILARIEAIKVEVEGMKVENYLRESRNEYHAYGSDSFFELSNELNELSEKLKEMK